MTIPELLGLAAAAVAVPQLWRTRRRELLFIAIPAALFTYSSLRSQLDIGFRHVLPVLVLLLIVAAAGMAEWMYNSRPCRYAVILALAFHAASSLHSFPNYISYANELWGGPTKTYKFLTDSNVDWGQSLKQVKTYLDKNPGRECWVAYAFPWGVNVGHFNLPCKEFGIKPSALIPPRVHGIVIVSSMFLSGVEGEAGVEPMFTGMPPAATIGGSAMLVFEGDVDTRAATANTETLMALRMEQRGRWSDVLRHSEQAVRWAPENPFAEAELCKALIANGQLDSAQAVCRTARNLLGRATQMGMVEAESRSVEAAWASLKTASQ